MKVVSFGAFGRVSSCVVAFRRLSGEFCRHFHIPGKKP